MSKNPRYVAPVVKKNIQSPSSAVIEEMVALYNAGQWLALETMAIDVTARYPGHIAGWRILSKVLLNLGKMPEAIRALSRVSEIDPGDADARNETGFALYSLGRLKEAEASYRQSLRLNPRLSSAHTNLGMLLADSGRLEEAAVSHQKAIDLNPASANALNNLGGVLRDLGRAEAAEEIFRRALAIDPAHFAAWFNRGLTLCNLGKWSEAQACYRQSLAINPDSYIALYTLGELLSRFKSNDDEARALLERAIALNPDGVDVHVALGNLLMRHGEEDRAWQLFRRSQILRPLITWPAKKEKPDFSVLLLDTPAAGCTPVDYLLGRAPYDRHFHCMIPGTSPDIAFLRSKADVVINMVADADNGKEILPYVHELVEKIARPTINDPRLIMHTDRESIARLGADIPLCIVPRTVHYEGSQLSAVAQSGGIDGFNFPLIVRLAGTHGGDDMEKVDTREQILAFVANHPEDTHYLTEFVDYQSADGLFRKYRLIYIDGKLYPYHLAIHTDWKVHHFRTDMANQAELRAEEETFLKHPENVFDIAHQAAIISLIERTGLNYCGIDCSLHQDGRIVVFEANAAMLVHDEKDEPFAFKNVYIAKIKEAFDAMLERLASLT